MNKREAISECKKLWKEIEKSGLSKHGFLNSPGGLKWRDKDYLGNCPLCEYVSDDDYLGNCPLCEYVGDDDYLGNCPLCEYVSDDDCDKCPLVTQYGKECHELGFGSYELSSSEWFEAVRGLR